MDALSKLKSKTFGYLAFGRDSLSYGLKLFLRDAQSHPHRITPRTVHLVDYAFFSCFWWEHVFLLADFLRKSGLKTAQKKPIIISGGFNTFNPVPLSCYSDIVVVGDGEGTLGNIIDDQWLPCFYKSNQPSVEWRSVDKLKPISIVTNGIQRIEIARGCKHKCKFCAVSHLKPYREAACEDIKNLIGRSGMKRISLFAPNPMAHSENYLLQEHIDGLGMSRLDTDVRLEDAWRFGARNGGTPRCGLEGISEKLRRSIAKPISNRRIINSINRALRNGVRGIFVYIILDLPGESKEDWREFKMMLESLGSELSGQTLIFKPSPNVFMPTPHTPMEDAPINWDRDYMSIWRDFFGRGKNRKWEITMAERSHIFSPQNRILQMVATRSGEEFAEIEEKLHRDKIIAIRNGRIKGQDLKKLINALKPYGGVDRYCGVPKKKPWKIVKFKGGKNVKNKKRASKRCRGESHC